MDDLKAIIERSWGWTGLCPQQVIKRNVFGNLLVLDGQGQFWRICPEELSCAVVADHQEAFLALRADTDFQLDWEMARLHHIALRALGPISDDRAYCFKIPPVLGGAYDISNIADISISELISFSGSLAWEIEELPDGASINLRIVD